MNKISLCTKYTILLEKARLLQYNVSRCIITSVRYKGVIRMVKFKVAASGIIKSIIFGIGFLMTAKSMEQIPVMDFLSLRFLTAAVFFEILRRTVFKFRLKKEDIIAMLPITLFMPAGYYSCEAIGLSGASSMSAGIIISFVPVLTFIFEILFLKEKCDIKKFLLVLTSVTGVILITIMSGTTDKNESFFGLLFLFLAASMEAFYTIASKKNARKLGTFERTYVMMWAGALIFNGINLIKRTVSGTFFGYFAPLFDLTSLLYILYMGIVPLVIAFFLYNYMLEREKPTNVSIYAGLETVVAIFTGVFFNSESLLWYHILGTVMIFTGVMGVNKNEIHSENSH